MKVLGQSSWILGGGGVSGPTLTNVTYTELTETLTATASEAGTMFYLVNDTPSMTGAAIEAAVIATTGEAYGSYAITAGANSDTGMFAGVTGNRYFHLVFKNVSGVLSNAISEEHAFVDYIVISDAEWDAVMALSTVTLDGKTMETSGTNFTRRSVDNHDFATGFTVRSAAGSSIPSIELSGIVSNLNLDGISLQMTGWPATDTELIWFGTGTFTNFSLLNSTARHGYGSSLVDVDMTANYSEYTRVDHVQTATTSTTTYALSWQDAAATSGWVEFFNRGANNVYANVGGSGVTATTGDTLVAAGTRVRIASLDPTSDTHIAILSATSTSEINARAEIGLNYYQADLMGASGAATFAGDFTVTGNKFTDLANAVKSTATTDGDVIIMDNDSKRIYMDNFAGAHGATTYVMRNIADAPYSRSGIAENLTGDAGDPHGDMSQLFGTGAATIGPVYEVGNLVRNPTVRTGVISQGVFYSDNNIDPSYSQIFVIGGNYSGGNANGIVAGEASYPAEAVLIYGNTVVSGYDLSDSTTIRMVTDTGRHTFVGSSIVGSTLLEEGPGQILSVDALELDNYAGAETAYFPNWADIPAAVTRAELEAAWATTGDAAGSGFAATTGAIDWDTTDPAAVIKWGNVPSGAVWAAQTSQTISTVVSSSLVEVLNEDVAQTVVPLSGNEWRSTQSDKTTEIQAWTTGVGTIEQGEYIQCRITTSASYEAAVTLGATINGFAVSASITTEVDPATLFTTASGGPWFTATSNIPAATSGMTMRAMVADGYTAASNTYFVDAASTTWVVEALVGGTVRVSVEDSTGTLMLTNAITPSAVLPASGDFELGASVDLAAKWCKIFIDGVEVHEFTLASGTGVFVTNREVSLLARAGGGSSQIIGSLQYLKYWYSAEADGTEPATAPDALIEGPAAVANAHSWKLGADAT